jgi:Rieske Fe-S protein
MSHSHGTEPFTAPVPPERRTFFQRLARWATVGFGAAATLAVAVPLVRYILGPALRRQPVRWVNLGPVGKFPVNETRLETFVTPLRQPWDGMTANTGVYVRNRGESQPAGERFWVFAVNCAHLGCPVSWFPQSGLFMCPCHGGVYYEDGGRASGPPPRGLFRCVWEVRDGDLWIQAPHFPTLHDTLTGKEEA